MKSETIEYSSAGLEAIEHEYQMVLGEHPVPLIDLPTSPTEGTMNAISNVFGWLGFLSIIVGGIGLIQGDSIIGILSVIAGVLVSIPFFRIAIFFYHDRSSASQLLKKLAGNKKRDQWVTNAVWNHQAWKTYEKAVKLHKKEVQKIERLRLSYMEGYNLCNNGNGYAI